VTEGERLTLTLWFTRDHTLIMRLMQVAVQYLLLQRKDVERQVAGPMIQQHHKNQEAGWIINAAHLGTSLAGLRGKKLSQLFKLQIRMALLAMWRRETWSQLTHSAVNS